MLHVDSPFNEPPPPPPIKKNKCRETLISRDWWPKNLEKMGNNKDIYGYANREGGGQFQKRI